ncbi:hypothetical protein ACP70R_036073 [Stipagrostis hirtigluma subsp. patula]
MADRFDVPSIEMDERSPAAGLPEELLVEILARLPARPLCRFRCVSRPCRASSSTSSPAPTPPTPRRRPRSGASPPCILPPQAARRLRPSTLPSSYSRTGMELLDSCNGLLLLRCCRAADPPPAKTFYVVCNPTTQEWVEVPDTPPPPLPFDPAAVPPGWPLAAAAALPPLPLAAADLPPWPLMMDIMDLDEDHVLADLIEPRRTLCAALAFDPAISPHFHVVKLVETDAVFRLGGPAVEVYSSATGQWVLRDTVSRVQVDCTGQPAYVDGFLHFATAEAGVVASVDTDGREWRTSRVFPECRATDGGAGFVGQSQGCLLYVYAGAGYAPELSVYAFDGHGGGGEKKWTLKHITRSLEASGRIWFGKQHRVVAVHPHCNVIFLFDSRRERLMGYEMDHGTTLTVCMIKDASNKPFFPYIPLYSEAAAPFLFLLLVAVLLLRLRRCPTAASARHGNHCPHPNPVLGNVVPLIRNFHRFLDWTTDLLAAAPASTIEVRGALGLGSGVATADPGVVDHLC